MSTVAQNAKWYKLMIGQHVGPDLEAPPSKKNGAHPDRLYHPGEVFRSAVDLEKENGPPGMMRKFERLGGEAGGTFGEPGSYPPELLAAAAEYLRRQQAQGLPIPGTPPPATPEEIRTAAPAPLPTQQPPIPQEKVKHDAKRLAERLEKMTLPQLREMAAGEEVDLEGAATREDIQLLLMQELT